MRVAVHVLVPRSTILVAAGPAGREQVRNALAHAHEVQVATTVSQAKRCLSRGATRYNAVVCGLDFDESRMFELLEFARSADHLDSLPFLAVRFRDGETALTESSTRAAEMLGARVVDLHELDDAEAARVLRSALKQAVPIERARADRPRHARR